MNFAELGTKKREDLLEMAKDMGISGYSNLKKQELIISLLHSQAEKDGNIFCRRHAGNHQRRVRLPAR